MPYKLLLKKLEAKKRASKDEREREQLDVIIVVLTGIIEIMNKLDAMATTVVQEVIDE